MPRVPAQIPLPSDVFTCLYICTMHAVNPPRVATLLYGKTLPRFPSPSRRKPILQLFVDFWILFCKQYATHRRGSSITTTVLREGKPPNHSPCVCNKRRRCCSAGMKGCFVTEQTMEPSSEKIKCSKSLTLQVEGEIVITEGWSISPAPVPRVTGRRYAGSNTCPQAA